MPLETDEVDWVLDDEVFKRYRERRMQELSAKVVTICSEKELIEKTKTMTMIVHFQKAEFKRCAIMDKMLDEVQGSFPEISFYRVDADICPVVAKKLEIRVLPFLGFFKDGYFVDQVIGFEKLGGDAIDIECLKKRIAESNIFKPISSL
ncbi:thioredoxin [Ordospora colligata]|uniref:Thioredoxin n=1 Tax=Ordospora colligata OC4 TaxID=1354746 RepID=A0A0B2UM32_9MICR|nr:thioredoxin [Ordospora colligata OC4]KHN70408.1 thioredoxin [Ordospora colligata OC4]TBU17158.1 thioredoxin [Ordospora colligata]TBU17408.1 thioredoxin [Ordospora colligata]TBU19588.1 thioredoxin [Ordospora colligata]